MRPSNWMNLFNEKVDLTEGNAVAKILIYSIPQIIVTLLSLVTTPLLQTIYTKNIGTAAFAIQGLLLQFFSFILNISDSGFIFHSNLTVQYAFGKKDENRGKYFTLALSFQFVAELFICLFVAVFYKPIFSLLSVPDNLYSQTKIYYFLYLFSFIMSSVNGFLSSVYFGIGTMAKIILFKIITPFLTLFSAYFLLSVCDLKIAGVALVGVPSALFVSLLLLFFIVKENRKLSYIPDFDFIKKNLKKLVVGGNVYAIRTAIIAGGYLCVSIVINRRMSENFVAAFATELPLSNIIFAVAPSFALFCIKNKSAGKTERLKKGLRQSILLFCSVGLVISAIYLFFGDFYFDMVGIEGELKACSVYYWRCRSIGIIPLALLTCLRYYMENTGYMWLSFFSGIAEGGYAFLCAFVLIPLGGKFFAASYTSLAFIVSCAYCILAYTFRFCVGRQKAEH